MGSISTLDSPQSPSRTFSSAFPFFHCHPSDLSKSTDPFTITAATGFMPLHTPHVNLPETFKSVQDLVEAMPIVKLDGSSGLLAENKLGDAIDGSSQLKVEALADLTAEVDQLLTVDGQPDMPLITAVFRDYSFLASAYLLEPCWEKYVMNPSNGYGLGRSVLPKAIAGPLVRTAEILDIPAFMSYAASYALYNYTLVDPKTGPSVYDNLRLIRAFERGLDPKSSEAGFILTHVHMVQETGPLVAGAVSLLTSVSQQASESVAVVSSDYVDDCVEAFQQMLQAMATIETYMEKMWSNSLPKDYNVYRTFIFGITNQSMFPDGVVYESINNGKPMSFRGESGANDSIIPLLDSLLQIPMPQNPLTKILHEFRSYRPRPHREFLKFVRETAEEVGLKDFCTATNRPELTVLYLRLLDHVRSFRWRHWMFAREYIIKRSKHPTATGGSPIITWLPNQLFAVMNMMDEVWIASRLDHWHHHTQDTPSALTEAQSDVVNANIKIVREIMTNAQEQRNKLEKEVGKYCQERGVARSD